jgi:hypothetical protein
MNKILSILLLIFVVLGFSSVVHATTYTYELSEEQTWADGGSTNNTTDNVTVRSYVPGSNSVTYKTITLYTPTYSSEANALGDIVGSVYHVYGSGTTAFVDPYDGPKRTVIYPAIQILHTRLLAVNDDRLAIGSYNVLGGHAAGRGFIYDVIYDQYTDLVAPNTEWTDLSDINNLGQIIGTSINNDGATRKGFTYDCENGFETFDIPGSSWTVPKKIDDEGNIYGIVNGIANAAYFIARPDFVVNNSTCSLVPRDDIADPVVFGSSTSFELSGDYVLGVKIGDFDGGGVNDFLIYHEIGKTILYLGEDGFDEKIKYYGDEFNTLAEGVDIDTEWDFNNDGFIDKVKNTGTGNNLYFAKYDGSYYYVPQKLPAGNLKFADLNSDGLVDFVKFNGQFASITYQGGQPEVDTEPVVDPDPVVDPEPVVDPGTVAEGEVPSIDANAYKVELVDTIAEIGDNSVVLSSGKILWFNSETIIKFNDASGFEVGQTLEFKAWMNPDGALIGIKVEVV